MKRLALMTAVILLLPGCDATQKALETFQAKNPDRIAVGVDEDGDALPDVFIQKDADGKWVVDEDGKPLEVAGTREALALAKADDALMSDELAGFAVLIGIPGLTYLGKLWGRWKPRQRAELWQGRFKDTVLSVQAYRDSLSLEEKLAMNKKVGEVPDPTKVAIYVAKVNGTG